MNLLKIASRVAVRVSADMNQLKIDQDFRVIQGDDVDYVQAHFGESVPDESTLDAYKQAIRSYVRDDHDVEWYGEPVPSNEGAIEGVSDLGWWGLGESFARRR